MKQAGQYITIVCIGLLLFIACAKDSVDYGIGEYYVDIVTYQGGKTFLLDNNKELFVNEGTINPAFKNGQRIWLNYSFLSGKSTGSDNTIRLNGASLIAQGELQGVSPLTIDTLPNDPIQLESAWIGSHYLNLLFSFEYKSESHKVVLVTHSAQSTNDSIRIFLKHDKNNDAPGYKTNAIASYDLKQLLGEPSGKKILLVEFNTSNYGNKVYEYKY